MGLTALLVCSDAESVQLLNRVLQDLGIAVECCGDLGMARARIGDLQFDAILIDCGKDKKSADLIAHARNSSTNQAAVVIALVDGQDQVKDLFDKGANFALYKPISREQVEQSIQAARSLIRGERRTRPRITVQGQASISYPGTEEAQATMLDLSGEGIAIQSNLPSESRFPPRCKVYFKFSLPEDVSIVRLSGEVMWQDSTGRVGIRFVQVPQSSRRILQSWVQTNMASQKDDETAPQASADSSSQVSVGLASLTDAAPDRRRSRHTCRLGAEVYSADNKVPNRCNLSDVSNGGCYVETTLPFRVGTPLEIVVRTQDLKLRIYGKVQSMHPGFGMGVAFSLPTEEQQKQVQQLIACAQAAPNLNA